MFWTTWLSTDGLSNDGLSLGLFVKFFNGSLSLTSLSPYFQDFKFKFQVYFYRFIST